MIVLGLLIASVEEEAADGMGTDISLVFHPDGTVNKRTYNER